MGVEENGKVVGIVGSPNKDGLTFRHVNKALEGVEGAVVISSTVGKKKKVEIIKAIKEKGLKLLNVKDADAYLKSVE